MKRLFLVLLLIASAVGGNLYAQFDATKTYVISNRQDANAYMQDNSTGIVAIGSLNDNSYWYFEATGNTDCYYVKNAVTGNYMQSTSSDGQAVATGTTPQEICVMHCSAEDVDGVAMYGFASTDQTTYDFTSGTIGANRDDARVQGYAAVAGTNHKSFWKVVEQGDYYIYNVETGLWLGNNDAYDDSWTTRAEMNTRGLDFRISAIDGGYKLDPKFGNNHSLNGGEALFYLDTGQPVTAWQLVPVEVSGRSNTYNIKLGDDFLGVNSNNRLEKINQNTTWQLVTRAERIAQMASATEENPVNATWLIKDPDFANANERESAWIRTTSGNQDLPNNPWSNRVFGYWNSGAVNFTQTIIGAPDGIYKMRCKGFYRDGGWDHARDQRNAGTETIRASYFINETSAPLMSIFDGAGNAENTRDGVTVDNTYYLNSGLATGNAWIPDNADAVSRCLFYFPEAYRNAWIEATVVGGTIHLGFDKPNGEGGDWVFTDDYELMYYGPVDISEYTNALNNAISNAEAFNGQTTDVLASNLASALDAAQALVNSYDTDAISAATGALITALDAARAADVSVLRPTVALAKEEGFDVAEQENYLANGTTNEVADRLRYVQSQRKMRAMRYFDDATIASITGSEPTNGESYYLLNVGTGMFFACNSDWGTHMALDSKGFLVKLIADGETNGLTDFHVSGEESVGWDGFNWTEEYFDKNGESKWHFVPVSGKANVYNLAIFDNHAWHIVYDPNNLATDGDKYFNVLKKLNSTGYGSDPNAQWILLTPAQRTELLSKATASSPIDATHFIKNPNFNKSKVSGSDDTKYGWTGLGTVGHYGRYADYVAEFFETTADAKTVVTGLPAGNYQVSVSGYYREKNYENDISVYNNGENIYSEHAHLVAYTDENNKVAAPFMHISAEHGKMPGVGNPWTALNGDYLPQEMSDAAQYFETGLYRITTGIITVGSDGQLTIGVEKPNSTGNDANWIVFDNFRLTYLGVDDVVVGEAGYTTFVAPYNIASIPEGVEAYACQVNENSVHLEPVTAIPADEAVVLKNEGTYKFYPASGSVSLGTSNDLQASDGNVTGAAGNIYALAKKTNGVGFYPVGSDVTVPAGKGYLVIGNSSASGDNGGEIKAFYGFDEDDATGINEELRMKNEESTSIFNVAGQRMSKKQKGINIVNGKKVLK